MRTFLAVIAAVLLMIAFFAFVAFLETGIIFGACWLLSKVVPPVAAVLPYFWVAYTLDFISMWFRPKSNQR